MSFSFDSDGYPTEEMLEKIKNWDHKNGWKNLLDSIKPFWAYSKAGFWQEKPAENDWQPKDRLTKLHYHLSTAGWSGNEDIIGALQENIIFWACCWVQSKRGGHYIFEVEK